MQTEKNEQKLLRLMESEGISSKAVRLFRRIIYAHYNQDARPMPWRKTKNPYRIVVSEVMLQQTQVERVLSKYREFIKEFPDFAALNAAPLSEVLKIWQGMGYNRRAIALKNLSEQVTNEYKGKLPLYPEILIKLPGIGRYSASAICTFAANEPLCFIETNIRRVYIHFFFQDRDTITDEEIMPLIDKTLDRTDPRQWYYALMDYGVKLRKEGSNPNRRSARYVKQSKFKGSNRQIRGIILRCLLENREMTKNKLLKCLPRIPETIDQTLDDLLKEGFIVKAAGKLRIT